MLTYAQDPLETSVKLATQEINIDGFGNEKDWETADEISGFWQWFPTDSLRTEQSTTAKFLVDDVNLYILITSYSESSEYIIPSLRRDYSGAGNDNVTVILDTFMDGTNGFMFGTNPLGVKRESLISNGGNNFEKDFNKSWDIKWETEATQQDGKTVSEIKIPLNSIQYPVRVYPMADEYVSSRYSNETMVHLGKHTSKSNHCWLGFYGGFEF